MLYLTIRLRRAYTPCNVCNRYTVVVIVVIVSIISSLPTVVTLLCYITEMNATAAAVGSSLRSIIARQAPQPSPPSSRCILYCMPTSLGQPVVVRIFLPLHVHTYHRAAGCPTSIFYYCRVFLSIIPQYRGACVLHQRSSRLVSSRGWPAPVGQSIMHSDRPTDRPTY